MAYLETKSPSGPVLQATSFKLNVLEQISGLLLQQAFSSWVHCSPEKAYLSWHNAKRLSNAHFTVWAINQVIGSSSLTALAYRKMKPFFWEGNLEIRQDHSNLRSSICPISLISHKDCQTPCVLWLDHNTVEAWTKQSDTLLPQEP